MPGSGKTTLAHALRTELHLSVVSRDDIKTGMHVTVDSTDPLEVARFGPVAFDVFFAAVGLLVANGVSLIAEAAFHRDLSAPGLRELTTIADVAHIAVRLDDALALDRYRRRAERGERHSVHADLYNLDRLRDGAVTYRLAGPEPMLEVDATVGYEPAIPEIVAFVWACRRQG
jgi:predicted kinase